jgi:hypothetical protein
LQIHGYVLEYEVQSHGSGTHSYGSGAHSHGSGAHSHGLH